MGHRHPSRTTWFLIVAIMVQIMQIVGPVPASVASASPPERRLLPREQWVEDPQLRTEFSRHYRAGDYMVAETSGQPVHRKDASGKWEPIPKELLRAEKGFQSGNAGTYKVRFTQEANGNRVDLDLSEGQSIGMALDEELPSELGSISQGRAMFHATASGDKVQYKDREGRADYDYSVDSSGVKELITLHRFTGKSNWLFPLSLEGLSLRETYGGSYSFVDPMTEEVRAVIPPPYAFDAAGAQPEAIRQEVVRSGDGMVLSLTVDPGWLADKERKFPVVIDPSIIVSPAGVELIQATVSPPGNGYTGVAEVSDLSGDQSHGLIRFSLPHIPKGAFVQSATLDLDRGSSGPIPSLAVYEVTQAWQNPTWTYASTSPSYALWATPGGSFSQYLGNLRSSPITVTSLVKGWVNRTRPNYGLLIKPDSYTGAKYTVKNPTLQIVYYPDMIAPTATISGLSNGTTLTGPVTLHISAADTEPGGVGRLDLLVDGTVVNTVQNPGSNTDLMLDPRAVGAGDHSVAAEVFDFAGNRAVTPPVAFDVAVPNPPVDVSVVALETGAILSWRPPADGQALSYNVYRMSAPSLAPTVADRVNATEVKGLTYTDTSLTGPKQEVYYYAVAAVGAGQVEGQASARIVEFPFAPGQPTFEAPWNDYRAIIVWPPSPRAGVSYNVYRALDPTAAFMKVASGLATQRYVDGSGSASAVYRVTAVDRNLESSPSLDSLRVNWPADPIEGLKVEAAGGKRVNLTWPASSGSGSTYSISRNGVVIGTTTGTSFADGVNRVSNSSFERGITDWSGLAMTTLTSGGWNGSASVEIVQGSSFGQTVTLGHALPVTVSAYVRTDGLAVATEGQYLIRAIFWDNNGNILGDQRIDTAPGTHDWERISMTVTPTARASFVEVRLYPSFGRSGRVWVDGIQVQDGNLTGYQDGLSMNVLTYTVTEIGPDLTTHRVLTQSIDLGSKGVLASVAAPADLTGQNLGGGQVRLAWTAISGVTYLVQRGVVSADGTIAAGFTNIGWANSGGYLDSQANDFNYAYRVAPNTDGSAGLYSPVIKVKATTAPLPAGSFWAQLEKNYSQSSAGEPTGPINLSWTRSGTTGATYDVYRTLLAEHRSAPVPQGASSVAPLLPPAGFARSSTAVRSDRTWAESDTPRFAAGKFGSALVVEESTSNLASGSQTDFDSFYTYWEGVNGATVGRTSEQGWNGNSALCVQLGSAYASTFTPVSRTLVAGEKYAFSAWVKGPYGKVVGYQAKRQGTTAIGPVGSVMLNGEWQHISTVATADVSGEYFVALHLYSPSGDTFTFYLDAYQIESKGTATSYAVPNVPRASELVTVPTQGVVSATGPFTLEGWFRTEAPSGTWRTAFSAGAKLVVGLDATNQPTFSYQDASQTHQRAQVVGSLPSTSGWHYWAFTSSGIYTALYVDGKRMAEAATGLPASWPSVIQIGRQDNTNFWNGLVDDLRISSATRSEADIVAAHGSGIPLPADGPGVYKLPLDGNLTPSTQSGVSPPPLNGLMARNLTSTSFADPANLLAGSGLDEDTDSNGIPDRWTPGPLAGSADTISGVARFVRSASDTSKEQFLEQTVELNQAVAYPLTLSAMSTATGVVSTAPGDYAVTVILVGSTGQVVGSESLQFSPGTHAWEFRSVTVIPSSPALRATVRIQLTGAAQGAAAFDKVQLQPGSIATAWVEGPVKIGEMYFYQMATKAPNGSTTYSSPVQVLYQPWPTVSMTGDPPGLGLDDRWAFVDFPVPGGTAHLNLHTGNLVVVATDSVVPGPRLAQVFRRTYNSQASPASGPLGAQGWSLNVDQRLILDASPATVILREGDGTEIRFAKIDQTSYVAPASVWMTLTSVEVLQADPNEIAWTISRRDGIHYGFDSRGRMRSLTEPNLNSISYHYDEKDNLVRVKGPSARESTLVPDSSKRVEKVMNAAGRSVQYAYDVTKRLKSATDPLGIATTYEYDEEGLLSVITDGGGRAVLLDYDDRGRLVTYEWVGLPDEKTRFSYLDDGALRRTKITDPLGADTIFTTDSRGSLREIKDARGSVSTYQYDQLQRLTTVTTARGLATEVAYEGETPRITRVTTLSEEPLYIEYGDYGPFDKVGFIEAAGVTTRFEYDLAGNLVKKEEFLGAERLTTTTNFYKGHGVLAGVRNELGHTTTYEFDDLGQLSAMTNPQGARTVMEYDKAGNPALQRDPYGAVTTFVFDELGRQKEVHYPDGGVSTAVYDRSGLLSESITPGRVRTSYRYDEAGRLISQTDNSGATTRYLYDRAGNQVVTFLPNGSLSRKDYDELGRVVREYDGENLDDEGHPIPGAAYRETGYDPVGNPIWIRLPNGYTASATYDGLNRITQIKQPPNTSTFTYDKFGRMLTSRDGNGKWTRYVYDALGRLTKVYDAANLDATGQIKPGAKYTAYAYDKLGRTTTVTDSTGGITRLVYNSLGQVLQEIDPLGQVRNNSYDAGGRLLSSSDRNGFVTKFGYDSVGRRDLVQYQDDCSGVSTVFDAAGNRLSTTCGCGTVTYKYDALGRLEEELSPYGFIRYKYDEVGLRTGLEIAEGSISYVYDRANRLKQVRDLGGNTVQLRYNTTGQLIDILWPDAKERVTFDPETNRMSQRNVGDNTFEYQYDAVGNIISIAKSAFGQVTSKTTYQYDDVYRLTTTSLFSGNTTQLSRTEYTYDSNGNRLSRSLTGMAGTPSEQTTYSYGLGNLLLSSTETKGGISTTTSYSHDAEGNLLLALSPNKREEFRYDSRNLLVNYHLVTSGKNEITYNAYDADGRRISQRVVDVLTGGKEVPYKSVRYQYDGISVVAVRDSFNEPKMAYARTPGGRLLGWRSATAASGPIMVDHLGSVLSMIGLANTYEYDEFGQVRDSGEFTPQELKFSGAPVDSSGSYHLSARFYNPKLGRFLTQDTYKGNAWQPWTQNLYTYVGNNPVNFVDPTGHAGERPQEYVCEGCAGAYGPALTYDDWAGREFPSHRDCARYGQPDWMCTTLPGQIMYEMGATAMWLQEKYPETVTLAVVGMFAAGVYDLAKTGVLGTTGTDQAWNRSGGVSKPTIQDSDLAKFMNQLYRGNAKVGTGSTADALRYELDTGKWLSKSGHLQKVYDSIRHLDNWLQNNPNAAAGDIEGVTRVLNDLVNAASGR